MRTLLRKPGILAMMLNMVSLVLILITVSGKFKTPVLLFPRPTRELAAELQILIMPHAKSVPVANFNSGGENVRYR
jgi:hypothetical protein